MSFAINSDAQVRARIVAAPESQPTGTQNSTTKVKRTVLSSPTASVNQRPTLSTNITVVGQNKPAQPIVKKTVSSQPTNSILNSQSRLNYSVNTSQQMLMSIQAKLGIPYLYGATGPNRYDCSSFVWKVFQEAGISFTRTSARSMWNTSEPVYGDDRFKFGTLVFFNNLGHVGIVVDENGFYQASSSKGVTYSPFKGYWQNRIVGYRRVPANFSDTK